VLDAGRVVESGTHAELVALGGRYAGQWAVQTGGQAGGRVEERTGAPAEGPPAGHTSS